MYEYLKYYDVFPLVVPADQVSEIRIRPRYEHAEFPETAALLVQCIPVDGQYPDGTYPAPSGDLPNAPLREWRLDGKTLVLKAYFSGEQEQDITISWERPNQSGREVRRFNLYSLKSDLYALRPFKGDFHIHTTRSDGKECPPYVAARYRQAGFDFIAVSDHLRYQPSQEAIDYWQPVPIDLKLYHGEEVHSPDNLVHIINFGGSFSVNELFRQDEAKYRREVAAIQARLTDVTPGMDAFQIAASEWVFDQIRAGGGLAVFCHPYWQTTHYVINEAITSEILKRRKFDAFELIGGFYDWQWRSNNCQVARYCQERQQGNDFPVVGLSDSHGTDTGNLFGWYYTIVLAKSDALPDLVTAMRAGQAVAVEALDGQIPRVFGDFRLVKYISFLLNHYFPRHRAICEPEGRLMLDYLGGETDLSQALKALQGRTAAYREKCFEQVTE